MLLRLLALILLVTVLFITYLSLKYKLYNNTKVINGLAIFIIAYKLIEILYGIIINHNWAKYPVEYSTIFYFFFPLVILLKNKKLLGAASTGAFVSGGGYLVSLVFTIPGMVETQKAINNMPGFLIGMLSHSILFYLSVLLMSKNKFDYKKEINILNLITILIAVHAAIMATFIDFEDYYLLILLITSGNLIPFFKQGFVMMSIYFIMLFTLYNAVVWLVYKLNDYLYNKYKVSSLNTFKH